MHGVTAGTRPNMPRALQHRQLTMNGLSGPRTCARCSKETLDPMTEAVVERKPDLDTDSDSDADDVEDDESDDEDPW